MSFNFKKNKNLLFFLVLIVFSLSSCLGKNIITKKLTSRKLKVCKVAVFPFYNLTKNENITEMLVQMFTIELAKKGINVVEPGLVKNFLFKERILNPLYIKAETLKKFRHETKADLVIGGQIIEAIQVGDNVKLTLWIWAKDTSTGDFVWYTFYSRTGEDYRKVLHFGKISSLSALSKKMIEEIIENWLKRGFFKCGI